MAQGALYWCPERIGAYRTQGMTSRFWNNWRSRSHSPCVIFFQNHWTDNRYQIGGDDELDLRFEILGGSDSPRFQLSLKHKPSNLESFISYSAWSTDRNTWSRHSVDYPEVPPPGPYTFSSSLRDVTYEIIPSFGPVVDTLRTWPDNPSTFPLRISWLSEDSPTQINLGISTEGWHASSRAKFETWKILEEPGTRITIATNGSRRSEESWSFFVSQPSPTLPPWWRYANPIHKNQTAVGDSFPDMIEGSELAQYHRKLRKTEFEVVPMTRLDHYQSPIEYEVFAMGSLMREAEFARETYESAFNRTYQYTLDPAHEVFPQKKGSNTYFIRIRAEPLVASTDNLPFAPGIGTDVTIVTPENEFLGNVISTDQYLLIMEVKCLKGRESLVLNDQQGHFTFGNPQPAFRAARQAIRGLMWGRPNIPPLNWLQKLLLAHENAAISRHGPGKFRAILPIEAHTRLNPDQQNAFFHGASFGESPKARLTIVQGGPGTGKTAVILALILNAMRTKKKILLSAETNFAVRLCVGVLNTYLSRKEIPTSGIFWIQREALETLGGSGDIEDVDEVEQSTPSYISERMRLALAESLAKQTEVEDFSLTKLISQKLRYLQDPDYRSKYQETEFRNLVPLNLARKALQAAHVGSVADTGGPSLELMTAGDRPDLPDPEEDTDLVQIAQKNFDIAWLTTCQYYMSNQARVVFVTAVTATSHLLRGFTPSTIIIDEASQITEVAAITVVATFFRSTEKLILAGDLHQNQPFVGASKYNEFAKTTQTSLMERMMITGVPSIFLKTQYRMHPHISSTVSRLFYDGRLIDGPNVMSRPDDGIFQTFLRQQLPQCTRHSIFFHVPGARMYRAKKGGSKVNPKYVTAVRYILQALIQAGATEGQIGLLTFYKAQLNIYQALIPPAVEAMTVDSSQGREFDFVIVDPVTPGESDYSLGFLTDPRKINVALSRAKIGLVIVGSKGMGNVRFTNVGAKIWKDIVKDHELNGAVHDLALSGREVEDRFGIPGDLYQDAQRDRR